MTTEIKKPNTGAQRIRKIDIFRVFLRSFFVQSMWNYRSLISVGFGMCLVPVLKRLCNSTQERRDFLERHLKFFNAHPYMASYALGVSIRLEEAFANGDPDACYQLDRFKKRLATVLGAVGDRLFWFTIKPAAAVLGVAAVVILEPLSAKAVGLIVTFLVYNIPHVFLRFRGINEGYQKGVEIYKDLTAQRYARLFQGYRMLGIAAFSFLCVWSLVLLLQQESYSVIFLLLSAGLAVVLFRLLNNYYFAVLASFAVCMVLGVLATQL